MTTRAKKMLAAIQNAGRPVLWHEAGALAYPLSTRTRRNIFGRYFRELSGSGLTAAHRGITELEEAGLVVKDGTHRYTAKEAKRG